MDVINHLIKLIKFRIMIN